MKKTIEIQQNQNIFDALLEIGGSLEGSIETLVKSNESINWEPTTGTQFEVDFEGEEPDVFVLELYKRNNIRPANKEFEAGTIGTGTFDDDFTFDDNLTGGGFGTDEDGSAVGGLELTSK